MSKIRDLTVTELKDILGTSERVLFFLTWLKHDRNATKAYKELHPKVNDHTARVCGSKMLSNIDMRVIASSYGLNHEKYFDVLRRALEAEKWNDFTGEREVDYKTIKPYHDKLGKLLGVESDSPSINIQGDKVLVVPSDVINKYGSTPSPEPDSKE